MPRLTGEAPVTWEWLWQSHNEHRIPLAKLLMIIFGPLTEDFSLLAYLDAFLLIGTAAAILVVLGRRRGRSIADAFIPIVLLHWGHFENLNWGFQFSFVFFAVLVCLLLLVVVEVRARLSGRHAVLLALGLLLLPLLGAQGLVFVVFLALWLMLSGLRDWKHGRKMQGLAVVLIGGLAIGLAGLYCHNWTKPTHHGDCPGLGPFAQGCREFLVAGWGTICHPFKRLEAGLTLLAYGIFGVVLIRAWWMRSERFRVSALTGFLGAALALTAALAWGRSGFGPGGCAATRYCLLSVPGLLVGYFICDLYLGAPLRTAMTMGMFFLAALLLPYNYAYGAWQMTTWVERDRGFVDDLARGVPLPAIAQHYWRGNPETTFFEKQMQVLRRQGWHKFKAAAATLPAVQEQACSAPLLQEHALALPSLYPDGRVLLYSLGDAPYLVGVRLKYRLENPSGNGFLLQVSWKREDAGAAHPKRSFEKFISGHCVEESMTLWLFGRVEDLVVDCGPGVFAIQELTLLLPQTK